MPAKKKPVSPDTGEAPEPAPAAPPQPAAAEPAQPKPAGEPMIKTKGIAAVVSFFLPGVGLALSTPKRAVEGAAVFIVALVLDVAILAYAFLGGPAITAILTAVSGGACCFLGPFIWIFTLLGLLGIPIVHILGAVHTWMRY